METKLEKEDIKRIPEEIRKYRPSELNNIAVNYEEGRRIVTCFCGEKIPHSIVPHIKKLHESKWHDWKTRFVRLNSLGYSWKQIMNLFRAGDGNLLFSWTVVEKTIREEIEAGRLNYIPARKKVVKKWQPDRFVRETTTVWDFHRRGDWAVHSGDYRGNWPPQVPRNLIERYTNKGDLVVDAFAGGGTTLIEAWLLERRSIGLDISRLATQTIKGKLKEMEEVAREDDSIDLIADYRPIVIEADKANALELSDVLKKHGISKNVVKLVCVHPPYLDSIKYTNDNKNDLALVRGPEVFYSKIKAFAREVKRVLSPAGVCAVLIGDVRKGGKIVPLGLKVLDSFLSEGYELDNIIIKTQHRDSSSEFWIGHRSNLLLMAHEYLFILRKA